MLHTELFTQYIANNGGAESALPSLFDKIPSISIDDEVTTFKDAFVLNFCDREIGFETEALFALKLEGRAKLVIPRYVRKLEELSKLDYINTRRVEKETRTSTSKTTDGGTDTLTHETSGTSRDSGTDAMTHETSGTSTDGGTDTNKRFKGENPLIDTTLDFNVKAISEQEQNATNYGKTNTTSGNGKDTTKYGKTNTTSGSGTDTNKYGKTTDNTATDTVSREYTNDNIEVRDLYDRILNDTVNIWNEIFIEFDSLFMQIW